MIKYHLSVHIPNPDHTVVTYDAHPVTVEQMKEQIGVVLDANYSGMTVSVSECDCSEPYNPDPEVVRYLARVSQAIEDLP